MYVDQLWPKKMCEKFLHMFSLSANNNVKRSLKHVKQEQNKQVTMLQSGSQ